jgi:hypothetical protein
VRFAKNAGNSGGGGGPAGERGGGVVEREPGGDEVLVVGHNGLEQEHQEHEEVAAGEWRERGVWGEVSRRESQNWKAPWFAVRKLQTETVCGHAAYLLPLVDFHDPSTARHLSHVCPPS